MTDVFSAFCCPACGAAAIRLTAADLTCASCQREFPSLSGVLCLFEDPAAVMTLWRQGLHRLNQVLTAARDGLGGELRRFDVLPLTRQRLERLAQGFEMHRRTANELLGDAGLSVDIDQPEADLEHGQASLLEHYDLVLRDWAWDTRENQRALEAVLAALGGARKPKRVAVLGAGGCRLAYDLHQAINPEFTVGLDNNPLLLLLAQRILFTGRATAYDFPLVPRSVDFAAKQYDLERPGDLPEGLHLLLADGLRPPFVPGAFDLIVTPWFIDVVGEDIREQIATNHRLLADGGVWLNHGPLIHGDSQLARMRYGSEEVLELVRLGGFEVQHASSESRAHLVNDGSGHARLEEIHTFCAQKRSLAAHDDGEDTPAWLVLPHLPVPMFAGLEVFKRTSREAPPGTPAALPAIQRVLALIDGECCLAQIADVLLTEELVPKGFAARDAAGALLLSVYRTSRALSAR
ncbi:MAG: hypothetical protein RJA70_2798 [Pseudomonadota bacterium]|jgi:hypothetical protein